MDLKPLASLLHLYHYRSFHIREANGDGLHLTASRRSSFFAIDSLRNAEMLMLPLPLGSGGRGLGVFLLDLAEKETLEVSISSILLLHLNKHRCLHIRQPNGDGLHLTASNCSSFSAIACLQKAEIFRQRHLFSKSSAWWSCWASPSG